MNNIWIVNDKLTCIKDVHTHWHELVDLDNSCVDMTPFYKKFIFLNFWTSIRVFFTLPVNKPNVIVRNCSFFPPFPFLSKKIKIISILQDFYGDKNFLCKQLPVIVQSDKVVCVSKFMYEKAYSLLQDQKNKDKLLLINNGVDENFWLTDNRHKKSQDTICFIGSDNQFKNIPLLKKIIENTEYKFILIMRDPKNKFIYNHSRVKIFRNISTDEVKNIIEKHADAAICTSIDKETFHLSGIQMMLMDIPIATTYVAIYKNFDSNNENIHEWGVYINESNAISQINKMMALLENNSFKARKFILNWDNGSLTSTFNNNQWKELLDIKNRVIEKLL